MTENETNNGLVDLLMELSNPKHKDVLAKLIINKEIPENGNDLACRYNDYEESIRLRDIYTKYCGWCMVTKDWIKELATLLKGKHCIEVMAGNGLISYALQEEGIDITPSDNFSWDISSYYPKYTQVKLEDAEISVKLAKDLDYVICSWPPYEDTRICDVIKQMALKHSKAKLIYIGEDSFGCTGCDEMWDLIDPIIDGKEAKIIDNAKNKFHRFNSIYDQIYLYKPNNKAKKWRRNKKYGSMADEELYSS